jgi:PB1 domain
VKYGNVLKRFSTFVRDRRLDYNMAKLILKIKDAFSIDQDADLAVSYEDDDGDVITLEQDEDLIDAIIYQQLNPLRIEVQLRTISSELTHHFRNMLMSSHSTSANGPVVQELDILRKLKLGTIEDINQSFHNDVRLFSKFINEELYASFVQPIKSSVSMYTCLVFMVQ